MATARKTPVKKTYKKVVTKKSGKTKIKSISDKKYQRKLKSAIKSEAKGKRRKVTGTTTTTIKSSPIKKFERYVKNTTTKKQTISKKNDKGRKKTFVATSTKKATDKDVAQAKKKRRDLMKIKTFHGKKPPRLQPVGRGGKGAAKAAGKQKK